jgi:hypothetical protein
VEPVDREAISIVVEFRRVDSARAEITHAVAGRGGRFTAFAVPGIGAKGFALSRGRGRGLDIAFANGRFFYLVGCAYDAHAKRPPTRRQLIAARREWRQTLTIGFRADDGATPSNAQSEAVIVVPGWVLAGICTAT